MNMLLALLVIATVAAAALAGVYLLTKDSIDKVQDDKEQQAMNNVLPNFNGKTKSVGVLLTAADKKAANPQLTDAKDDKDSVYVNLAYDQNGLFGAAVKTYTDKAFSGKFTIMVGFDQEGKILGTAVISASETPGLGDKIKSDWANQFKEKGWNPVEKPLSVNKDGGEVQAITAATISSRAFCDAVNRAAMAYQKVLNVEKPNQKGEEK